MSAIIDNLKKTVGDEEVTVYPITSTRAVYDENGKNVSELIEEAHINIATTDTVGVVKPDGNTISINTDGTIGVMASTLAKYLPFEDSYVSDADKWLTNGYTKTGKGKTTNLPSQCTGSDQWGVLFFIAENVELGTGTQMYFPIDGTYKGCVFTRSILKKVGGTWSMLYSSTNMPKATTSQLGVIKVGSNLSVDSNGVLSATATEYAVATATSDGLLSKTYVPTLDALGASVTSFTLEEGDVIDYTDLLGSAFYSCLDLSCQGKLQRWFMGVDSCGWRYEFTFNGAVSGEDDKYYYNCICKNSEGTYGNYYFIYDYEDSNITVQAMSSTSFVRHGDLVYTSYVLATSSFAGLMSAEDKAKLDAIKIVEV